ncbi:MFS transporter [Acinetobacter larvae]|uniref:MFS transporter n=1 Tax=Acinetobacter larvae TaxID=1789224 RepID=A0A1B2LW56_9GAMM|nr:MFS transporter [Acinetobacter larvae]AOA57154.1 MFS transporter [Acinetobacter larvae]
MQPSSSNNSNNNLSFATATLEKHVIRKLYLRLLPFLMLCYFIAYIDRVNVGFAALTMNQDIALSASIFGFAATLFFVAYVAFEIPSNIAMEKFGARRWISRIMITWGIIGFCSAFVTGPISFSLSRFLLGAAEAGFFPGVLLYLTLWFPKRYMAGIVAMFMVAIPLSNFFGAPLSALLLNLHGWLGFKGWQILLMLEALPAVVLGLLCLWILPNRPQDAKWLTANEQQWLSQTLAQERLVQAQTTTHHHALPHSAKQQLQYAIRHPYFWLFAIVYAGSSATSNILSLWMPQILKQHHLDTMQTAWLTMIPFGLSALFMVFWGLRANQVANKRATIILPLLLTSISLFLGIFFESVTLSVLLFSLTLMGNYALKGPFWSFVASSMPPSVLAVTIAGINTLAHIGTGLINASVGMIKDSSGSFAMSLLPLALLTLTGAIIIASIGRHTIALKSFNQE